MVGATNVAHCCRLGGPDPTAAQKSLSPLVARVKHASLAWRYAVLALGEVDTDPRRLDPEHRRLQVEEYYATFLRRAADAPGLQAWVSALAAGLPETEVVRLFLVSPEYQARFGDNPGYVTALYADVLGRRPDRNGERYWRLLADDDGRNDLVPGFLYSAERRGRVVDGFYESLLRPAFDDPEYRNDFAVWARRHLHDNVLAERLGGIDPLDWDDLEAIRRQLLDVIEDRLSEIHFVPWVAPGREFFFLQAHRVILDTGLQASTPAELGRLIPRLPSGSILYHFIEARRRPATRVDDFSTWLADWGDPFDKYRERLAAIDFHLWSLTELRTRIARCLGKMPELVKP